MEIGMTEMSFDCHNILLNYYRLKYDRGKVLRMRRTKLWLHSDRLQTARGLGSASNAGVDVCRLNFSHGR